MTKPDPHPEILAVLKCTETFAEAADARQPRAIPGHGPRKAHDGVSRSRPRALGRDTFNVIDDFTREALAVEIDLNLPASRVIRTLERVAAWRGYPAKLRLDNGPEFVALAVAEWAERKGIKLDFIEPGRPMQNGFIERFNGSFRRGVLDMHVFRNLSEVREQAEHWLADYNREIPHDSLSGPTPAEFRQQHDPATLGYGWH
ncbi:putative transposase [Luteibacter sp. PvP120]